MDKKDGFKEEIKFQFTWKGAIYVVGSKNIYRIDDPNTGLYSIVAEIVVSDNGNIKEIA